MTSHKEFHIEWIKFKPVFLMLCPDTLVFDNSSSVLTSKKLYHEVELHELDTTDYYTNVAPDLDFDEYIGTRL